MGAVFVLLALALGSTVLPMYNYVGAKSVNDRTLTAVENGMHYAISVLTNASSANNMASISSPISVPTDLTDGMSVAVSFSQFDPTLSPAFSSSPVVPASSSSAQSNSFYTNPALSNNANASLYFLLTATTGSAAYQTTLQSVLLGQVSYPMNNYINKVVVPSTPYFAGAVFGQTSVQMTQGVDLLTEAGGQQQANLASNGTIGLSGTNTVDGNLSAYSPNGTRSSPNISGTANSIVNGSIDSTSIAPPSTQFQSDAPGFVPTPGFLTPNVLGNGIIGPAYGGIAGGDGALQAAPAAPVQTPNATQLAEFNSTDATNMSLTNTIVTGGPNPDVINLGTVNLSGNQTLTLQPGQYIASSINITDSASINVNIPSGATAGVAITLTGNPPATAPSGSTAAAFIGGNGVNQIASNQLPGNFQIFYNGTENVQIAMNSSFQTFSALVYAPNAAVSLFTGVGPNGAYHGAIVGNEVALSGNGTMYYNPNSILPSGSGAGILAPSYVPPAQSQLLGFQPYSFKVISWQEPTRSGVQ